MAEQTPYEQSVAAVRAGADADAEALKLYDMLTDDERLWLLDGDWGFWECQNEMMTNGYNRVPIPHGQIDRLGIPGFQFSDGPRGVVMGNSTAFPVSMARGATFDPELEERIGEAIGQEVKAQGGNFYAGVCINLPRHPAWGRAQETYSDDPLVLGTMGSALTKGVRKYVMACAKHFALNSMENARFQVNVTCDEKTLHEVYLPHFKATVDAGVDAIMSSYNSVNGEWAGQNHDLLTGVLRDDWGFKGVVVSDFSFGIRNAAKSLTAGLDVEEPCRQQRAMHLADEIANGEASWSDVKRSGQRILATQLRFDAEHTEPKPDISVVASQEHQALAREASARSMVLLKNESVLPLKPESLSSMALIGRLANMENTGDRGSSNVHAPYVVTPYQGFTDALPNTTITTMFDDDPQAAAQAAKGKDAAVVVVGYTYKDEGEFCDATVSINDPELNAYMFPAAEGGSDSDTTLTAAGGDSLAYGGDRASLCLRPVDAEIIKAVSAVNPKTVVVVVTAGAVLMEEWRNEAPAILMSWYSGMEGGHALADVVLGKANPSGRLPFSIPTSEDHLPYFDRNATEITYDRYHGQRLLDKLGVQAAYPFGYGLSYSSFAFSNMSAERKGLFDATVSVDVTNTSDVDGRQVVEVYGVNVDADHAAQRTAEGERFLVGFASIEVPAGATVRADVDVNLQPVSSWDCDTHHFVAPSVVTLMVSSYAGADDALTATI